MIRTLASLAVAGAATLVTTAASAQTTATTVKVGTAGSSGTAAMTDASTTGTPWSAALLFGYGSDNLKFGIGARGGYTFPFHLYVGAELADHFPGNGVNVFYIGPEAGYEIPAGPIMVRPYAGFGFAHESFSEGGGSETVDGVTVNVPSVSGSQTDFAFWFGGTVLYPVTQNIGLGVDGKIMLVDNFDAFIFTITGQYHF